MTTNLLNKLSNWMKKGLSRSQVGTKSRELPGNPRLYTYSQATLKRLWRYAAMITLLLTLACGEMWGAQGAQNTDKNQNNVKATTNIPTIQQPAEASAENLNVNLSGEPSVKLIQEESTNWTAWLAGASILVDILILVLTIVFQQRLKRLETKEIRTQKIQETELKQQALMYEKLVDIDNFLNENEDAWQVPAQEERTPQRIELEAKLNSAKEFYTKNTLYIKGKIKEIVINLLDIYEHSREAGNIDILLRTQELLEQYVDAYHSHKE